MSLLTIHHIHRRRSARFGGLAVRPPLPWLSPSHFPPSSTTFNNNNSATRVVKMTRDFTPTKNPIIFIHGLFGFGELSIGSLGKLRYWRGVEDFLMERNVKIGAPSLGPVSSIKERAEKLHQYLESNFAGQDVNLIGFSMGGLDARYLISHIKPKSYKVLSLATVATPHRGSSFMDYLRENLGVGSLRSYAERKKDDTILSSIDQTFLESLMEICGTPNQETHQSNPTKNSINKSKATQHLLASILRPLDAPAFTNLTREYCAAFNRVTPNDPAVHYSSYAASASLRAFAPLAFPKWVIEGREGENDGLVSIESARWGTFRGLVNCDHWDLVPSKMRAITDNFKSRPFDHVRFYKTVVTHLAKEGF